MIALLWLSCEHAYGFPKPWLTDMRRCSAETSLVRASTLFGSDHHVPLTALTFRTARKYHVRTPRRVLQWRRRVDEDVICSSLEALRSRNARSTCMAGPFLHSHSSFVLCLYHWQRARDQRDSQSSNMRMLTISSGRYFETPPSHLNRRTFLSSLTDDRCPTHYFRHDIPLGLLSKREHAGWPESRGHGNLFSHPDLSSLEMSRGQNESTIPHTIRTIFNTVLHTINASLRGPSIVNVWLDGLTF